jgi:integrase
MASIQRIKSPLTGVISYRAQVRVKGRPAKSETFPNRKEAEKWASGLESAIRENRHHPHLAGGKKTFAEAVRKYLTTVVHEAEDHDTRERHLNWFADFFVGLTLAEITPDKIAEARDALAREKFTRGKDELNDDGTVKVPANEFQRSGATINRYLATLSHMLNIAKKEWRLIDRNPVSDISKKKESRGRTRFLSEAERDKLLEACAKSDWPLLHPLVMLAITSGARRGELINLKWDDIDLRVRETTVDARTGEKLPGLGRAILRDTKNGESRSLPLVGKALEVLRELKLKGSAKSEYVFPNPSGHPGPFENFDHRWDEALTAAGIEGFRFHDLRHTCASYLAANGASLLEIADVLGHKTLAMVRRYSHLTQSHKVSVIERMAKAQGL